MWLHLSCLADGGKLCHVAFHWCVPFWFLGKDRCHYWLLRSFQSWSKWQWFLTLWFFIHIVFDQLFRSPTFALSWLRWFCFSSTSLVVQVMTVSSANHRWFSLSPLMLMISLQSSWWKTSSRATLKSFDDFVSPCFTPHTTEMCRAWCRVWCWWSSCIRVILYIHLQCLDGGGLGGLHWSLCCKKLFCILCSIPEVGWTRGCDWLFYTLTGILSVP